MSGSGAPPRPEATVTGAALVARYEELRNEVLQGVGRGLGLVLFLRQGMKAWIEAWSYCAPSASTAPLPNVPRTEMALPPPWREAIVPIVAGMALRRRQGVNES